MAKAKHWTLEDLTADIGAEGESEPRLALEKNTKIKKPTKKELLEVDTLKEKEKLLATYNSLYHKNYEIGLKIGDEEKKHLEEEILILKIKKRLKERKEEVMNMSQKELLVWKMENKENLK